MALVLPAPADAVADGAGPRAGGVGTCASGGDGDGDGLLVKSYGREDFSDDAVTEVLPGLAWVVPGMLSDGECDEWIRAGTEHGIGFSQYQGSSYRTAKRTIEYVNEDMSALAFARLPAELLAAVRPTCMGTETVGLHSNWRVLRYDPGDQFPAHTDQQDEVATKGADGVTTRVRSTHTLLLALSGCDAASGGATRFFPTGRLDEAVDVNLPRGYGLVFQQKGLLHSGMPVQSGVKFVAQAGVLRALPLTGKVETPHVFKFAFNLGYKTQESDSHSILTKQGQICHCAECVRERGAQ